MILRANARDRNWLFPIAVEFGRPMLRRRKRNEIEGIVLTAGASRHERHRRSEIAPKRRNP
jgi:hypothetical protein